MVFFIGADMDAFIRDRIAAHYLAAIEELVLGEGDERGDSE